jgi:hypothetical protein
MVDVDGQRPFAVSAELLREVADFGVARPGPRELPDSFGVRWLAYAAREGLMVRWANGDRWRPRAVTARDGRLLCEIHARPPIRW